jgi:hypothetical protein
MPDGTTGLRKSLRITHVRRENSDRVNVEFSPNFRTINYAYRASYIVTESENFS